MSECKVELRVAKGVKSITRGIRINGHEIPNVAHASVSYDPMDARRITLEILPTDVTEVDEADWDGPPMHIHEFDPKTGMCSCGQHLATALGPGAVG